MTPPRDLVHHPDFDRDCEAVGPLPLVDAALRYATYRLAQQPLLGIPIEASGMWAQPLQMLGRDLVLYYRFDSQTVTLRALKVAIK